MQFRIDLANRIVDQLVTVLCSDVFCNDFACSRNCYRDRLITHFADC